MTIPEDLGKQKSLKIPLFPLTNAVFFPKTMFPIHVFEERYLEMVKEALQGDRLIGIILLKKGWHHDYFGAPDIYDVGTVGRIKEYRKLPDGTFNIILEGLYRFKIVKESRRQPYREAEVKILPSKPLPIKDKSMEHEKRALIQAFTQFLQVIHERELPEELISPQMTYDELVNLTSQLLDHLMSRKQRLLEEDDIRQRGRSLRSLIENRLLQYRIDQVIDTEYEGSPFN